MNQHNNSAPLAPQDEQDLTLERELQQLKHAHDQLREDKVRTEENLANLEQQLQELTAEAEAAYGTADPLKLEELLQEKREENARLVSEYRAHIHSVRSALENIETESDEG